ncbi:hypothetical protein [Pleomorphovibrio marinus]|uniref:hypothetical protein n=1 Tax=Pleomorphovibrio marinus TaxID=2164132 RepID=UPI000E0C4529|nr:hypothetical protein [Pleomorphovibrio marinus]
MTELILYSLLLLALLAHITFAMVFYRKINKNKTLSFREKNDWRLKALIFPAYYWFVFKNRYT